MAAVRTELIIEQGTTWAQSWRITNFDLADGTTWSVQSQIRRTETGATVLHDFTEGGHATLSDDIVTISLDPATSTGWVWTHGVYDVEIHGSDGRVFRIAEGTVTVSPEVTRD